MTNKEYSEILDSHNIDRQKCKCCDEDIFYDNTNVIISKRWGLVIHGKSYKTIKNVSGISYPLKVCQSCLTKKYSDIKNINRTFNVMCEPTKFAFDIPDDVYIQNRSRYAMTKQHMIDKYGTEDGLKKWEAYCQKQAETNTLEYKKQKYGMTEEEFDKYNKSRASTIKNFIKRYGIKEGKKRWDEYCERQSITKKKEYILEKYGEEELVRILSARNKGFVSALSKSYSKESQDFFRELDCVVCKKYSSQYHDKNGEKEVIYNNKTYFLDYFIPELNICVEFNGSVFHGDPYLFKDDDRCLQFDNNVTAKELRDKDQERYKLLEKNFGIKTYIVWESQCRKGMTGQRFAKEVLNMNF